MLNLAASLLEDEDKLVAALVTQLKCLSGQIGKVAAAVLVSEHLIGLIYHLLRSSQQEQTSIQ
jgi:hypothetical protein